MSTLTSLLARDQMVPVKKIEEALQRQVVSGGDTETVLLEMGVVPEDVLSAYRAALFGLLPATRDEVMRPPRETLRLVPREIAEKNKIVPLWAEGRTLVVAVSTPLPDDQAHQLGFLLGFELIQRVVTDVRLQVGLGHHYGIEISARYRRLAEKLRTRDPGVVPYVAPPQDMRVDKHAPELPRKARPSLWDDEEDEEPREPRETREGKKTAVFGSPAQLIQPAPPPSEAGPAPAPEQTTAPGTRPSQPPLAAAPMYSVGSEKAPSPASARPKKVTGTLLKRVRGPLLPKAAQELLAKAEDRDEILEIFFGFSKQFFDYTAIFIVHEDIAEGRDSFGSGANTEEVQRIAVPLDVPGSFADARASRQPTAVSLLRSELDQIVARDLKRDHAQPALLVPLAIRNRVVVILYADRGGEAMRPDDVPELLAILPRVVDAFERLVLKKKSKDWKGPSEAPPAAREEQRQELKAASKAMFVDAPRTTKPGAAGWGPGERKSGVPTIPSPEGPTPDKEEPPIAAPATVVEAAPTASPSSAEPTPLGAPPVARARVPTPLERPASSQSGRAWQPAPRKPTPRPAPLSVLGVPRSAPPPPMPVPVIPEALEALASPPVPEPAPGGAPEGSPIAGAAAKARERGRELDDEPMMVVEETASVEDVTDVSALEEEVEEADPSDVDSVDDTQPNKRGAGVYVVRDVGEDVFPVGRRERAGGTPEGGIPRNAAVAPTPSTRPAAGDGAPAPKKPKRDTQPEGPRARRPTGRPDPRREDDEEGAAVEVVRVSAQQQAPSESPTREMPRRAPKPAPAGAEPKVIVDMGDQIEGLVRDLSMCGPDDETNIVGSLLQIGEAALPVLVQHFPGPLWFDRHTPHRRLPRGRDISGIARAFVAFRERAVPYVVPLLDAGDADGRFYATLLGTEFVHPSMLEPLSRRIFDEDQGTRALALDVIKLFRHFREFDQVLSGIRTMARSPSKDPMPRRVAAKILGELRDPKAVQLLIQLLREDDKQLAQIAQKSLVLLTRQDFGDAVKRWELWYEKSGGQHRIEWLIDALDHASEQIRADAAEELKRITQEYYGYHPAASRKERERAQMKYRAWWEENGKKRFSATAPPQRSKT